MAVTLISHVTRNPSLTHAQFKHHYETVHMPLVHELFGDTMPKVFKRNFVDTSQPTVRGAPVGADLILEMVFEDHAAMVAMQARWGGQGVAEKIMADEKIYGHPDGEKTVLVGEVKQ